ncbi:MAG: hypothetical protein WBE40_07325 [Thermoplasmata archaeon]
MLPYQDGRGRTAGLRSFGPGMRSAAVGEAGGTDGFVRKRVALSAGLRTTNAFIDIGQGGGYQAGSARRTRTGATHYR